MCFCALFTTFIISLIIGLPTIILGCNDFSCPLQEKVIATTISSNYLKKECTDASCSSVGKDGQCTGYTHDTYDCSYWSTSVTHQKGSCDIRSGPYDPGAKIEIFVNKYDNVCTADTVTISRLPIVGIVFLSIAGITLISMCLLCYCDYAMEKNKTNIYR